MRLARRRYVYPVIVGFAPDGADAEDLWLFNSSNPHVSGHQVRNVT